MFARRSMLTGLVVAITAEVVAASRGGAQTTSQRQSPGTETVAAPPATVVMTPGARYRAGWLHRALLGTVYRDLWTTPITVDVLDLHSVAGGLRPTQVGGSMQTRSLRFQGANGREYVFRPSEKDFTKGLPEELRETLVRDIAQDQVSGYHPAAATVVSSLLDATGLRHARPRLVVMADDSLLGEHRREFAGVLGTFEERPGRDFDETPESLGAIDVISSERLFDRLRRSAANRVNARTYLAARLFDILVGDRDRHRDQWRWGRFSNEPGALWEPIPRDRDMPFSRFEGLGPLVIRATVPHLVTFASSYPSMVWLNWNAREIDRRLLTGLDRMVWDSVALALQRQLTDSVLTNAIAQMPPPFVAASGSALFETLVARRRALPTVAAEYYAVLAREVNVYGTEDPDEATVTREPDGSVRITLASSGRANGETGTSNGVYFDRRFLPNETREVRIHLDSGGDRATVRGSASRAIHLRMLSGPGDDIVLDSIAGGDEALRVYDTMGNDRLVSSATRVIDRRPFTPPTPTRPQDERRDWGSWTLVRPAGSIAPGLGLLAGVTHTRVSYGFRRMPFATRSVLRVDGSHAEARPRLTWDGTVTRENRRDLFNLRVVASGIELIRFHGLGNATSAERSTGYYRSFQNLFRVEPQWSTTIAPRTTATAGLVAQFTTTRDQARTLVGETRPYGSGHFGQTGVNFGIRVDRSDSLVAPKKGYRLSVGGSVYAPVWSVTRTFSESHAQGSIYLSGSGRGAPTLALRAGGRHVWGAFPYHEAAQLGGVETLRGWDQQRFAGRSSAYGAAELRSDVAKVRLVVPTHVGVLAFQDVGRVFADGDASKQWHTATGFGVWLAPLMRSYTMSLSVARGRERTGFYVASGFAF